MKRFTNESLYEVILYLEEELENRRSLCFEVLDPDISEGTYAGTCITLNGTIYRYRGYKAWVDLAQLLFCKMKTPTVVQEGIIKLSFVALEKDHSFHTKEVSDITEKYGVTSSFSLIHKSEEPAFIYAYTKALKAVKIQQKNSVLNLGINTGEEFESIKRVLSPEIFKGIQFTGIDHSLTCINEAKRNFPQKNMNFYAQDINELDALKLDRFDLIISIGTLQSPSIDFKLFFRELVKNYLRKEGALILGFPNCRWIDGEMVYGAKAPNYSYSEMSLVIKDIYYCKKYLQQHKFRVTITGKDYLFLTATSIR